MANLKNLIALTVMSVMLLGCTKNTNIIYIGNAEDNDSTETVNSNKKSYITFSGYIESVASYTKTLTSLPMNEVATIYIYKNGQNPDYAIPSDVCSCLSHMHGLLEPLSNKDSVYLAKGKYEFYSISNLSKETPPVFTNGISEGLKNGIDYAWAKHPNFEVESKHTNVPLTYVHSATQIAVKLHTGKGITLDSIVSASFYPSKEGGRMHLNSGYIEPAVEYSNKLSNLVLSGHLALSTILPIKTTQSLKVTYELLLNNDLTKKEFVVNIPLPDNELKAGITYLFNVTLETNEISFSNVNIIEWINVDNTGKPLYPSQYD